MSKCSRTISVTVLGAEVAYDPAQVIAKLRKMYALKCSTAKKEGETPENFARRHDANIVAMVYAARKTPVSPEEAAGILQVFLYSKLPSVQLLAEAKIIKLDPS
jgi:hypothetical protein